MFIVQMFECFLECFSEPSPHWKCLIVAWFVQVNVQQQAPIKCIHLSIFELWYIADIQLTWNWPHWQFHARSSYFFQLISLKDNDSLAALFAVEVNADLLIILSDVDGIYTAPPGEENSQLLSVYRPSDSQFIRYGEGKSRVGTGGMESKVNLLVHVITMIWPIYLGCLTNIGESGLAG